MKGLMIVSVFSVLVFAQIGQALESKKLTLKEIQNLRQENKKLQHKIQNLTGSKKSVLGEFKKYEADYFNEINKSEVEKITQQTLSKSLAVHDVVIMSDYHGDAKYQNQAEEIFWKMAGQGTSMAVVFEWMDKSFYPTLQDYYNGLVTLDDIRDEIYEKEGWDFRLTGYLKILKAAKKMKARVILPESSEDSSKSLYLRDRIITQSIEDDKTENPGTRYFVLYGVYHVLGKGHLSDQLRVSGNKVMSITSFGDEIFWKALAKYRTFESTKLLKLSENTFYVGIESPIKRTYQEVKRAEKKYRDDQALFD